MKVAVSTSDGKSVDRHFGNTDSFLIFKKENGNLIFEDKRKVTQYSSGEKNHHFDQEKFETVFEVIKDCKKLYCQKIGEKPKEALLANGIETIEFDGLLDDIT